MKIANKSLKEILAWISKNSDPGFTRGDLKKGLKLDNDEDVEKIFGFLKQPMSPNEAFIKTFDNSGRYVMTAKVMSELNSQKSWYEKPAGLIIIGVLIVVIGAIILKCIGLNND